MHPAARRAIIVASSWKQNVVHSTDRRHRVTKTNRHARTQQGL
jgi:hypothetical protein